MSLESAAQQAFMREKAKKEGQERQNRLNAEMVKSNATKQRVYRAKRWARPILMGTLGSRREDYDIFDADATTAYVWTNGPGSTVLNVHKDNKTITAAVSLRNPFGRTYVSDVIVTSLAHLGRLLDSQTRAYDADRTMGNTD